MYVALFGTLLGLLMWGLVSRHPLFRLLARLIAAALSVASLSGTVFLFSIGQKAHWTSDGPGMLFIMLGVGICALCTFLFGSILFHSAPPPSASTFGVRDPLERLHSKDRDHATR